MKKLISALFITLFASAAAFAVDAKDVKIQDINKNPSKWLNKEVTVQGQVVRTSPGAVVIDGDGIFNDRILVIDRTPKKGNAKNDTDKTADTAAPEKAMKMNSEFRVTGKVERLTISQIRDRYYSEPDAEVVSEFTSSMPVIVSDLTTATPATTKETAKP